MGLDEPVEYPLTYSRLDETLNRDDGGSGVLKDATSDLYAFGPNGESACSLGYTFITDKAMCQEAVETLAPGNWTGVSNDWGTTNPKGCFYDGGGNQSGDMTICIRKSEPTCTTFPTSDGSDQERCENGNSLGDGYFYVYNEGRGTESAECGYDAECWCYRS